MPSGTYNSREQGLCPCRPTLLLEAIFYAKFRLTQKTFAFSGAHPQLHLLDALPLSRARVPLVKMWISFEKRSRFGEVNSHEPAFIWHSVPYIFQFVTSQTQI